MVLDFSQGIRKLHEALRAGTTTPERLLNESFERIEHADGEINAFLRVNDLVSRDRLTTKAAIADAFSPKHLLDGIPYALKDNMCYEGIETTCASKILEGYIPPYTATVAQKLDDAGAILVGKANMDEFAMGSSTENSSYFPTKNPWHKEYVPGGSSGGSAAAVAAGMVPYALGSDTGGSIRQPSAFCGVVGLKPTYGRVSRYGLVAFASSFDQIGPITNSVEDAAIVLQAIAGADTHDATSAHIDVPDFSAKLTGDIRGLKVGVAPEFFADAMDEGVRQRVEEAVKVLKELGAEIQPISLPHTNYAIATYYLLAPAEASSNLARFDGVRYGYRSQNAQNLLDMYSKTRSEGFGREVKRRILIGTYALSSGYYDAYYKRAQKMRTLIRQDFEQAFSQVDVIVSPTTPTPAFLLGEKTKDPVTMYMTDMCTIPVNLAGLPAISVPCGLSQGLPVGLQIIGKMFDEQTILQVADAYEKAVDFAAVRTAHRKEAK